MESSSLISSGVALLNADRIFPSISGEDVGVGIDPLTPCNRTSMADMGSSYRMI